MKKLSKVMSFKSGLKNFAPLVAGMVTGGVAVGVIAADYKKDVQPTVMEVPAAEAFELTTAQKQEVMLILRSLRETAADNLAQDLAGINMEIATKLTLTLGEPVTATSSRELLPIIDAAIADLERTQDLGVER